MQHIEIWCVSRKSMFQNQPEAIKKQERFLHMKMILNITFKKTGDETQKSNFAKENLLFTCHAAKVEFSPTAVSSIITWNSNLRLGKRVCVAAALQWPLECPLPLLLTLILWVESSNEFSPMHKDIESQQPPVKGFISSLYLLCCSLLGSFQ